MPSYVYILASKRNGTLYTGVTADLIARTWIHKEGLNEGFTRKYGVKMLVYYEQFDDITQAVARETQIKRYYRQWKLNLIEKFNPQWNDLYDEIAANA